MPDERGAAQGQGAAVLHHVETPAATAGSIPCTSAAFAELSAELLRNGVALRFQAQGSSMAPLVRAGDVLLVRPVAPSAVRVGDVVLCRSVPGRMIAHRVVRRLPGDGRHWFAVQGDAAASPDGVIPEEQVYGRVAAIERAGARIELDRPFVRMLGLLAVLRAHWTAGKSRPARLAARLLRRLPGFSDYLG